MSCGKVKELQGDKKTDPLEAQTDDWTDYKDTKNDCNEKQIELRQT